MASAGTRGLTCSYSLVLGVERSFGRLQLALAFVELLVAAVATEVPLGVQLDNLVAVVTGVGAGQTNPGRGRTRAASQAGVQRLTGHVA